MADHGQEVESMVARLTGDSSSYVRAMKQAEDSTKLLDGGLQLATKRLHIMGFTLRGYGATAVAMLAPLLGIGSGFAAVAKGIRLAAEEETQTSSFKILLKGIDNAKARMESLVEFADKTPFNLPEVVQASKILQSFGGSALATGEQLTMVGDMAGMAGRPFSEIATWVGRMYSGLKNGQPIGEAASRLQELALITGSERVKLEQLSGQVDATGRNWKTFVGMMGKFKGGMEDMSKTLSGMFSTMQDSIDAALREIGKHAVELLHLRDLMELVTDAGKALTDAIKSLSPEMRAIIVGFASMATAAIAMAVLWPYIGGLIMSVAGFMLSLLNPLVLIKGAIAAVAAIAGLAFSPIGIMVGAAVAFVTLFIVKCGGVTAALKEIRRLGLQAWEWLKPIRTAVVMAFTTIKQVVTNVLEKLQKRIQEIWDRIAEQAKIDWDKVRDYALRAVFGVEYAFVNFEKVAKLAWLSVLHGADVAWRAIKLGADVAWAGIKYGAVALVDALVSNIFSMLMIAFAGPTGMLVVLADAFGITWEDIGQGAAKLFSGLLDEATATMNAVNDAVTGAETAAKSAANAKATMAAVTAEVDKGSKESRAMFEANMGGLMIRGLNVRPLKDLKEKLRVEFENAQKAFADGIKGGRFKDELDKQMADVGTDFETYYQKRLKDLAAYQDETGKKLTEGKVPEDPLVLKAQQNAHRLEAALARSVQAVVRYEEYRDKLADLFKDVQQPKNEQGNQAKNNRRPAKARFVAGANDVLGTLVMKDPDEQKRADHEKEMIELLRELVKQGRGNDPEAEAVRIALTEFK